MEFFELMFRSFWTFLGFIILIGVVLTFLYGLYERPMRHHVMMKHGYPPEHCDADGNFPAEDDDEETTKDNENYPDHGG